MSNAIGFFLAIVLLLIGFLVSGPVMFVVALLAFMAAGVASGKGRSFGGWLLYGMLLPLISLIHALVIREDQKAVESARISSGVEKKCPRCAELVRAEAVVCRFCGHEFASATGPVRIEPKL